MPFQISPSVNISEIDLTTVIPAVSTTEGAIAAHLGWGPVEKRVLITSENELASQYSSPNANTFIDFFTAASFLAYGNALWVSRTILTATTGGTAGVAGNTGRNSIVNAANTADTVIKNDDDYEDNYSSGISGVGEYVAKYPGVKGNSLKVSVCPSATAWETTLTGTSNVAQDATSVTGTGTAYDTEVVAGDVLLLGPDLEQVSVASVTNSSVIVLATAYSGNTTTGQTVTRRWEYYNNVDNAPGTSTFVSGKGGSADELHIVVADEDGEFTGVPGQILETFEQVSFASDAKTDDGSSNYYKNVINNQSKYVWWTAHDAQNTNAGSAAAGVTFVGDTIPSTDSLVNGRDGALPSNAAKIKNYDLFNSPEEVDVSFILGSDANQTVASHIIQNIAESRLDCIACVSPERADVVNNNSYVGKERDDIITYRNTLPTSSYGVMDSGWKQMYDKYNDVLRYVPLNGDTAGLMVRTDLSKDPWWSPAGYNRGNIKNIVKLAYNPSKQAHRDELFKAGVNPVVSFPGQGTILFGDKTMIGKNSAFDAINVRRLFIVLEKAIATAAKFTLFEFNDDFTRSQFINAVEPFLRDVQGRRGIIQSRVVCDETNNTDEVINRNEFVGDIFIDPNRVIRTIQLNFVATRSGVQFEEVVGQF